MILRYDQGMSTHPEPIDHNHPAIESLAREVLEREERLSAYTYSIPLAAQASWDATRSEQVRSAPALAHAVIDLTAKVKRVEDLADDMDHDADLLDQTDDLRLHLIAATHREDATRLRAALNGDDR